MDSTHLAHIPSCCIKPIGRPDATPLPVKEVAISSVINQDIASVSISQTFLNDGPDPIEVEYLFPIPNSSSLSSLKIFFQDQVIEAQVKDLEEAKQQYSDAIASGDDAFLAQISDQDDIATLQIGVIRPQDEVKVELVYATELSFESGRWKFHIPVVFIPRYGSNEGSVRSAEQKWAFTSELHTSSPARDVRVNLENAEVAQVSDNLVRIASSGNAIPQTDFAISYTTDLVSLPLTLVQRDPKTNALGIHFSFQPPTSEASLEDFEPSGEFILVLDRSGSMQGGAIETAKQAVQLFIKSLPERSLFNIVSFGSRHSLMFQESQPYSSDNIDNALDQLRKFRADLGGTEIFAPLHQILTSEPKSSFPRYVFVVTDGAVSNVRQIVEFVELNHKSTRVSTIGIGSGASTELIEEVARAGRGSSTHILEVGNIKEGVLSSLERALKPSLNDVTVEWQSGQVIAQHPVKPFYAFNGDRVAFNAIVQDTGAPLAFKVSFTDSLTDERKHFEFENDLSNVSAGVEAIALAVKGAVGTSDEVRLAVMFQILTKKAGLVATIRREGQGVSQETKLVKVSLQVKPQYVPSQQASSGIQLRSLRMRKAEAFSDTRADEQEIPESIERVSVNVSETLINLQSPDGSWTSSDELSNILSTFSVDLSAARAKHPEWSDEILATSIVVAVLAEKLSEFVGTWKLASTKGVRWLKKQGVLKLTLLELVA